MSREYKILDLVKEMESQLASSNYSDVLKSHVANFKSVLNQSNLENAKRTFEPGKPAEQLMDLALELNKHTINNPNTKGVTMLTNELSLMVMQQDPDSSLKDIAAKMLNDNMVRSSLMFLVDDQRNVKTDPSSVSDKAYIGSYLESFQDIMSNEGKGLVDNPLYSEALTDRISMLQDKLASGTLTADEYITFGVDEVRPFVESDTIKQFLAYTISNNRLDITLEEKQERFNQAVDNYLLKGGKVEDLSNQLNTLIESTNDFQSRKKVQFQEVISELNLSEKFNNWESIKEAENKELKEFISAHSNCSMAEINRELQTGSGIVAMIKLLHDIEQKGPKENTEHIKSLEERLKFKHLQMAGGKYEDTPGLDKIINSNNRHILKTFGNKASGLSNFSELAEGIASKMDPEKVLQLYEKFPHFNKDAFVQVPGFGGEQKSTIAKIKEAIIDSISQAAYAIKNLSSKNPDMGKALNEVQDKFKGSKELKAPISNVMER